MPAARRRDAAPRERPDACPGAWQRHEAADGALARFRPVGGATAPAELRLLAGASATASGAAPLELTSRGSWQVRGLSGQGADDLAAALSRVGGAAPLLDDLGRDVPCSVVASPRSPALDAPARAVADALRGRTDVPGRLLIALDDGSGDVLGLDADVTVVLGGDLHLAGTPTAITSDDPAALALAAVEAFLAVRGDAWRVREVGADAVLDGLRPRERNGSPWQPRSLTWPQAIEVLPRLGEVSTQAAEVLADLGDGGATLRVTPWRTVVLRDAPADAAARLEGLVETGPSPWSTLSACVGAPRCAKSHTDVRGDLARAVAAGRAGGSLHAHWVGCARACGTPAGPVAVVEGTPGGTYRTIVRAGKVCP
ncbi:precorrin-3B synthase [Actinomycetospora succinea]|uniref:Precorrin-3B synthase n=1 Tax=Actinomycetospora succinea TaxID=663603 RepID=A0A4R6UUU1_9PSEU|nr:precorrin-3B synthase [Actinomycetospora succinea]TDQ50962.1 precorrin-3B synthase [Actinomycetospora succinea]